MSTLPLKSYLSQSTQSFRVSDINLSQQKKAQISQPQLQKTFDVKTTDTINLSKEALQSFSGSTQSISSSETAASKRATAELSSQNPTRSSLSSPVDRKVIFAQAYQKLDNAATRIAEIVKGATNSGLSSVDRAALKNELNGLIASLSQIGTFAAQGTSGANANLLRNTFSARFNGFDRIDISSADSASASLDATQKRQSMIASTFSILKKNLPA